jgi:hypothetical protein
MSLTTRQDDTTVKSEACQQLCAAALDYLERDFGFTYVTRDDPPEVGAEIDLAYTVGGKVGKITARVCRVGTEVTHEMEDGRVKLITKYIVAVYV